MKLPGFLSLWLAAAVARRVAGVALLAVAAGDLLVAEAEARQGVVVPLVAGVDHPVAAEADHLVVVEAAVGPRQLPPIECSHNLIRRFVMRFPSHQLSKVNWNNWSETVGRFAKARRAVDRSLIIKPRPSPSTRMTRSINKSLAFHMK